MQVLSFDSFVWFWSVLFDFFGCLIFIMLQVVPFYMHWLGGYIQDFVERDDIVLDVGCGIMQATSDSLYKGSLKCKTILGMDIWLKYLDQIKDRYPTLCANTQNMWMFPDSSYDVVLCLDVLEHLELSDAMKLIDEMKRITRKHVIIYTPEEFETNEENESNAWDLGNNPHQKHKCVLTESELKKLGFDVSHPRIYSQRRLFKKYLPEKSNNFGIWSK